MGIAQAQAAAPAAAPPITLDELDRDELAELVRRAYVIQRPRDLWGARWTVASERASQAFARESEARELASTALDIVMAASGRATKVQRDRWEAARIIQNRAEQARKRADRREARAWAALEACR